MGTANRTASGETTALATTKAMEPPSPGGRRRRRGLKRLKFQVPRMPSPVRALWEGANPEERQRAHAVATAVLRTWLGRTSREEAAKDLGVAPLRFWQLSQQAVAGLVAGCLRQPRYRGPVRVLLPAQESVGVLRKRIAFLEGDAEGPPLLIGLPEA